jgi:hypothetical protein
LEFEPSFAQAETAKIAQPAKQNLSGSLITSSNLVAGGFGLIAQSNSVDAIRVLVFCKY